MSNDGFKAGIFACLILGCVFLLGLMVGLRWVKNQEESLHTVSIRDVIYSCEERVISNWKEVKPWEAMKAKSDGIRVQRQYGNEYIHWRDCETTTFSLDERYRVEVPTKLRPMFFEELFNELFD
jgi:hypothetical protein